MRLLLLAGIAAAALAAPAQAVIIISGSVGGAPTLAGVGRDNLDDLPVIAGGPATSPAVTRPWGTISFGPNSQVASGGLGGVYAPPFLSGSNGAGFGPGGSNQPDGANATPYLTVFAGSSITLTFNEAQKYLGLLWGSIDGYNAMAFFLGSTLLQSFTGADAQSAPNGDQGVNGTRYVNFTTEGSFDRVVLSSGSPAFEFDNLAFARFDPAGADPAGVPAPAALGLFGLALAGLLAARRRRS